MCQYCEMWEFVDTIDVEDPYSCSKCLRLEELQLRIDELETQLHTLRYIREGEYYLDVLCQGMVTPTSLTNSVGSEQGKEGVAISEAGRGNQEEMRQEPQPLSLTSMTEALTQCKDGIRGCGRDEQPGCSTVDQEAIQEGGVRRNAVVIGDSIIRGVDRVLCGQQNMSRRLCCLPGARVKDISAMLERNLQREGEDPVVVVHVGTNDIGRTRKEDLLKEFEQLGNKLKSRTSRVLISGLLPEPRAKSARIRKIKKLNAWLKDWCGNNGFGFLGHWHQYWDRGDLFCKDGLHLNGAGTGVLANHITRAVERSLN